MDGSETLCKQGVRGSIPISSTEKRLTYGRREPPREPRSVRQASAFIKLARPMNRGPAPEDEIHNGDSVLNCVSEGLAQIRHTDTGRVRNPYQVSVWLRDLHS